MRYDELTENVTTSSPDDWALVQSSGGYFLNQLGEVISSGQHWLEVGTHYHLAVHKDDVNLRLAWGLTTDRDLTFDGWVFPDPKIDRETVDAFWRGALVARWMVLSVDGCRCYLPHPDRAVALTGESPGDTEMAGWTVKESETALARLVQTLTRPGDTDFDDYLKRTGAVVIRG